ncbi:superoxide dismutase family protein [Nesterenkonia muleiensis]|uniref:superoxide dismutase family protein n=1 Tax=Nesterenkonia muleiensis TaxID=2282648 RepID=UPI000E7184A0|nr:superoxide dismutase family protein [Nesterenkonia muleiensis]
MRTTHHWPALAAAALTSALLLTSCGDGDDAGDAPEPDQETTAPPAEGADDAPQDQDQDQDQDQEDEDESAEPFAQAELQDVAGNEVGTADFTEEEGAGVRVAVEVRDMPPGFRGISIHQNGVCEVQSANEWGQIGDFFSAGGHLQGTPEPEPDVIDGEEGLEEDEAPPEEGAEDGLEEDETWTDEGGEGEQPPPQGSAGTSGETPFASGPAWEAPANAPEVGSGGGFSFITVQQQSEPEPEVDHPDRAGNLPNVLVNQDGTGYIEFVTDRLSEGLLLEDGGRAVIIHSAPDHHGNIPGRYAPYGPDAESQATGDTGTRVACGVVG